MKHYKHLFIAFLAVVLLGTPWVVTYSPKTTKFIDTVFGYIGSSYSAVFLHEGLTVKQLQNKYDAVPKGYPKVRIMIVPGHEPGFGGAEYKDLREREMTVVLGKYLADFFKNNTHYEVIVSRDDTAWNPDLQKYFDTNWNQISTFVTQSKSEMARLVSNGIVTKKNNGVEHTSAPQGPATRLFGINKWNNENNIDIAIHIHFNDYPRSNQTSAGKYSGLTIYVPESQYSNSTSTRAIADSVFKRLSKYNPVSNFPPEKEGVVEEQELIAIGSYNTLDVPSMLIEYGYMYEPQFADKQVRDSTLKDLAFQTYLGVQDFFGGDNDVSTAYDTLVLPYSWQGNITTAKSDKGDVLALQTALILEGMYPPKDKSKNDCPRSGTFGPCTETSLGVFQDKHGITNEKDQVGVKTKKVLNDLYSVKSGFWKR